MKICKTGILSKNERIVRYTTIPWVIIRKHLVAGWMPLWGLPMLVCSLFPLAQVKGRIKWSYSRHEGLLGWVSEILSRLLWLGFDDLPKVNWEIPLLSVCRDWISDISPLPTIQTSFLQQGKQNWPANSWLLIAPKSWLVNFEPPP